MISFTPFPNLSTDRLILRQLQIDDENEILFLRSDERMLEFTGIPKAKSLDDARAYIEKINKGIAADEWIMWGITLKENDRKIIGTICFWNLSKEKNKAEIGYVLHPDFWGKGIMQEAAERVIVFGFETMKLDFIDTDLDPKNQRSIKLLERNHFVLNRKNGDHEVYVLPSSKWNV